MTVDTFQFGRKANSMERQQLDQRTIKLEIPLPRFPRSPVFRFSIRTIVIVVAAVALSFACYRLARETERARHIGGYHLVVSTPYGMTAGSIERDTYPDLITLVGSCVRGVHRGGSDDPTVAEMWPPKVWIKRADWKSPELETRIDIEFGGTFAEPELRAVALPKSGDRVFVSYGTPPSK
jgi:hypothetical protein